MHKKSILVKFQVLGVFQIDKTSLLPTELKFDRKLQSTTFFFKKAYFYIFNQKTVD